MPTDAAMGRDENIVHRALYETDLLTQETNEYYCSYPLAEKMCIVCLIWQVNGEIETSVL